MATYYVDFLSGSNTTGNGTSALPFQTVNFCLTAAGTEIRIAKTEDPITLTIANSATFTYNTLTITTSSDMTASISIGDYIGKMSAAGNGSQETYYRVNAINSTSITLDCAYWGTTENVGTIKKIPIATTGAVAAHAITVSYDCSISGGWNLTGTTPVQSGETWFKSNNARTAGYYAIYCPGGNGAKNFSKFNIVETNVGIGYNGETSTIYDSMTLNTYNNALTYVGLLINNVFKNLAIASTSGVCWLMYTSNGTIENCFFFGAGGVGIQNAAGSNLASFKNNIFFKKSSYGFANNGTINYEGVNKFYYCGIGANVTANNVNVKNCEFYNCTYGIYTGNLTGAFNVTDCKFTNCTYGFYATQNMGSEISNSNFYSCQYGVALDNYSADIVVRNCYFDVPTTNAVYRLASSGTVNIINSTIDNASIVKGYNITTGYYPLKQYIIVNSFGQNGTIWGCGSKMKDSTTYRTSAPSLALAWNATTTTNNTPMKIMSSMVNSGASATFGFYMKTSNASWAGTIQPVWRLNDYVIKTESTAITALSTSWLPYSYSCASSYITAGGELSLEFVPNMNTYTVNIDDFTVT